MKNEYRHFAHVLGWILVILTPATFHPILQLQDHEDIQYLTTSTVDFDWIVDVADTSAMLDSLTGEAIYQVTSNEGYPLYFYQIVTDNVCFDNKCRPIDLKVYWNITGRYFGFMLEDGEFLSRRDHEAFDSTDYLRLHQLLADHMLPFTNLTFEELVDPGEGVPDQVDGVTGATSRQLSAYVVDGAAYTTYVLWSAIYGSAREVVEAATLSQLDNKLLLKILESPSQTDQIWGLNKIMGSEEIDSSIEKRIVKLIEGEDFFVSHTALQSISPIHLQSIKFQDSLFEIYEESRSNIRKPIIELLYNAPQLSPDVLQKSYELLPHLNGNELGQWLELYRTHSISDQKTSRAVAKILENENTFIADKAFEFLKQIEIVDQATVQAMQSYEKSRK